MSRRPRRLRAAALAIVVALALAGCTNGDQRFTASGDLAAHDPDIVAGQNGSPWYVYSTGDESIGDGNIEIRSSTDGHDWKLVGTVWKTKPAWLSKAVPGVGALWAPMLFHHGATWYLYYAASTFGSNRSVIALATNTTLDPHSVNYRWVDRGQVFASHRSDNFNAIDPTIIDDSSGTGWMAFGSFWGGIHLVKIAWPSGKRADATAPKQIAYRGSPPDAIEGATILRHGGYYYLIVSLDSCCQGAASTYNMGMGRSKSIGGPYLDKAGTPMLADGHSPLLATVGNQVGPGGESYSDGYLAWHFYDANVGGPYVDKAGTPMLADGHSRLLATAGHEVGPGGESYSEGYLAWHFYDANVGGATTLAIQKLGWTASGWPTLAQN